jgi:hypothetical protein
MSEVPLDAAGRRRSPATMPGFHAGAGPATTASAIRPIHRRSRRSSRSCGPRATRLTAAGCADSSWCSGVQGFASTKRSPSTNQISTPAGLHWSFAAAGAGDAARSAWTSGGTFWPGANCASSCRSARCSASSAVRHAGDTGRPAVRADLRRTAAAAGVGRRFAPHQLRHAHAVEMAHEGVPMIVIQRQLGHSNLGITSIYLQGIDNAEIIETVHARHAPMVRAARRCDL